MRRAEIKQGRFYEAAGIVVECIDLGEGRFPRVPKFRVVYPLPGQERLLEPRQITRELSQREVDAYKKVS